MRKKLRKQLTLKIFLLPLMILLVVLISCQTPPSQSKPEIPPFPIEAPARPVLDEIPTDDVVESIRALTINMGRLTSGIESWENYNALKDQYIQGIISIYID